MTAEESRWRVASAFRAAGAAVYEGRARPSSLPDLVVMDQETGDITRVRVLTGKRPRGAKRLSFDRRRLGLHADVLALVDPESGSVDLRPLTQPDMQSGQVGTESPPGGCFRTVEGVGT